MSGDVSLGYWSRETSHSLSHHHNNDDISDDESLEVSDGDGICGHKYFDTIHSYSLNRGFYHISDNGRGGYRSQDTSHYYSRNCGARVDVEGRGRYRYHISHYSSHKPGCHGVLLSSSVSSYPVEKNVHGDERVGYSGHVAERVDISCDDGDGRRNKICDDGDKRGYIIVDYDRCVSSSKEASHYSSLNIG